MDKFIVVNGRILDYDEYRKDFSLLKRIISVDLRDYFSKLGFVVEKMKIINAFMLEIVFYNPEMDFRISIISSRKKKFVFV